MLQDGGVQNVKFGNFQSLHRLGVQGKEVIPNSSAGTSGRFSSGTSGRDKSSPCGAQERNNSHHQFDPFITQLGSATETSVSQACQRSPRGNCPTCSKEATGGRRDGAGVTTHLCDGVQLSQHRVLVLLGQGACQHVINLLKRAQDTSAN